MPYGDPPTPLVGKNGEIMEPVATASFTHTAVNVKYRPAPTDAEIEAARTSQTRDRFKAWLEKRMAQASVEPQPPGSYVPIHRSIRRRLDRVAPLPTGERRTYEW